MAESNSHRPERSRDDSHRRRDEDQGRGGYRRDDRGGRGDNSDRGGYRGSRDRDDRGRGGDRRDDRGQGGFRGRDDRGGDKRGGDRGGFRDDRNRGGDRRDDRGGPRRDDRGQGGFRGRDDRGGDKRGGDRGRGGDRRDDRGGPRRDDRGQGGFRGRDDRGGDRGGFRDDRNRGGDRRDDRGQGGFRGRDDRGGDKRGGDRGRGGDRRDDRGGPRRDDRGQGGFRGRDDRGGDKRGGDRGGFRDDRNRGGDRRDDRGGPRRDDRGGDRGGFRDDRNRGGDRRDDREQGGFRGRDDRSFHGHRRDDRDPYDKRDKPLRDQGESAADAVAEYEPASSEPAPDTVHHGEPTAGFEADSVDGLQAAETATVDDTASSHTLHDNAQPVETADVSAATGDRPELDNVATQDRSESETADSSRDVSSAVDETSAGSDTEASRSSDDEPRAESESVGQSGEPEIPDDVDYYDLDRETRAGLRSLPKGLAESVGRRLVTAGRLIDTDPGAALSHMMVARKLASRIAVVREAAGVTAYQAGEWQMAISELRTAQRLTGTLSHIAMIADAERALGRPERAVDAYRDLGDKKVDTDVRIELLIVAAGARRDMGHGAAGLAMLQVPELNGAGPELWRQRLRYAYADALAQGDRIDDARRWFAKILELDQEDTLGVAERLLELEGVAWLAEPDEFESDEDDDDA